MFYQWFLDELNRIKKFFPPDYENIYGGPGALPTNKKPLQALDFSLFRCVSSESQSFHIIESIIEIKQILEMNGSKTWL